MTIKQEMDCKLKQRNSIFESLEEFRSGLKTVKVHKRTSHNPSTHKIIRKNVTAHRHNDCRPQEPCILTQCQEKIQPKFDQILLLEKKVQKMENKLKLTM